MWYQAGGPWAHSGDIKCEGKQVSKSLPPRAFSEVPGREYSPHWVTASSYKLVFDCGYKAGWTLTTRLSKVPWYPTPPLPPPCFFFPFASHFTFRHWPPALNSWHERQPFQQYKCDFPLPPYFPMWEVKILQCSSSTFLLNTNSIINTQWIKGYLQYIVEGLNSLRFHLNWLHLPFTVQTR